MKNIYSSLPFIAVIAVHCCSLPLALANGKNSNPKFQFPNPKLIDTLNDKIILS